MAGGGGGGGRVGGREDEWDVRAGSAYLHLFIAMGKISPLSPNLPCRLAGAMPFTNINFMVALLAWMRCPWGGGAYFVT